MPFLKERNDSVTKIRIRASERNGWGHAILTTGSSSKIYKGEWKGDKKDGRGSEWNIGRGLLYEGGWSQDRKSGYGELFRLRPDGERRKIYAGYWSNDRKDGFGRYCRVDGVYYEGDFRFDRKHGFGRFWHGNGAFYQGNWRNDLYHGEGWLVLANGNRYEGSFFEGRRQGRGTFWHTCTGQLQEGHWYKDNCVRGTIEDTDRRQSACAPTSYPIPELEFPAVTGNEPMSRVGSSLLGADADRDSLFRLNRESSVCTVK